MREPCRRLKKGEKVRPDSREGCRERRGKRRPKLVGNLFQAAEDEYLIVPCIVLDVGRESESK